MVIRVSDIIHARSHGKGNIFSVHTIGLERMHGLSSPLALLDNFRVSGQPFGPHPHAGFSAITYVFEDSPASLRSRDSLGNDVEIGPGGIVWLQAGRGALHQEVPAVRGAEIHGAQIYVNLSMRNKLAEPKTMYMLSDRVPEWRNPAGDRIRVLVGCFGNVLSLIKPVEPYSILEAFVLDRVSYPIHSGDNTVIYVLDGELSVEIDGKIHDLSTETAIALSGAGEVHLSARGGIAHVLVLSGPALNEPVVADGPFIMNDLSGIRSAYQRFHSGEMGDLEAV
ncbi:pirin family protein [Rhizobium paknamense]|uniref:Redox-sensitive bicupin YhaK (Pirin superfamily) n=1 Tax=Rhizobium paknamense TaxID=1206817 RepID=A0ABU0IBR0_9HYPH|nr:pirin family protein [Rhizobium paknamense]MDQ0455673.1 redox-sensitive bicupin YhaK (pirin superfamily) [Rhizobium paknamense]